MSWKKWCEMIFLSHLLSEGMFFLKVSVWLLSVHVNMYGWSVEMTRNSLFTYLPGSYLLQCMKNYHFLTRHVPIFVLRFGILSLNGL